MFERRLAEEKLRADKYSLDFVYFEIHFANLIKDGTHEEIAKKIWMVILRVLADFVRGSDVKGFLTENIGIGVLLLDSQEGAIERISQRIETRLASEHLHSYVCDFADTKIFKESIYSGLVNHNN
jgi:hypothetical protein